MSYGRNVLIDDLASDVLCNDPELKRERNIVYRVIPGVSALYLYMANRYSGGNWTLEQTCHSR